MPLNVLVIDRERELVDSVADVLEMEGMDVRRAWRLDAVLEALHARPPSEIVTHATVPDRASSEANLLDVVAGYPAALVVISSRPFFEVEGIPGRAVQLAKPFGRIDLLDAIDRARSNS